MKYSITRKINLGRFGLEYESIDIGVSDCESWEEAEKEIQTEKEKIINAFTKKDFPNDEPFRGDEFSKKIWT